MNKKILLIKILVISIIFLFMDVNFSSIGLAHTESTLIKQTTKDYVDKTSIGKPELKILGSYEALREWFARIFFDVKNVGSETFNGYVSYHWEISHFFNRSYIWSELNGGDDITLNPGQKTTFGYIYSDLSFPFGFYYGRIQISASGDDDSPYGNKMTEIILMWDFLYFPVFRFFK